MSFKKWIEAQQDPYADTVDMPAMASTNSISGQTTLPYKQPQQNHPDSTVGNVEKALSPLEAPKETGYSGTPDYSAPEQFFSTSDNQPDSYQMFLRGIPEMFPQQSGLAKEILDTWLLFKSEMLRRSGKKQYMDRDAYPIHYKVLADPLSQATQSLDQVKQFLDQDNDPELGHMKQLFKKLYSQHQVLRKAVEQPLNTWLKQSRENPFEPHKRAEINPEVA